MEYGRFNLRKRSQILWIVSSRCESAWFRQKAEEWWGSEVSLESKIGLIEEGTGKKEAVRNWEENW